MASTQSTTANNEEIELPEQLAKLSSCIDESPESLATGNKDLQLAALQAAKYVFDLALQSESKSRAVIAELLNSLSPSMAPQTRSQAAKVGALPEIKVPVFEETPLPELCLDGMDKEQIWAQLELRNKNVADILEFALESTGEMPESDDEQTGGSIIKQQKVLYGDEDEDDEMDFDDEEDEDHSDEDHEGDSDDDSGEEEEDDDDEELNFGEEVASLRDPEEDEEYEDVMDLDVSESKPPSRRKGKGKGKGFSELNDGFFDLATFNAETETAEARAVSRGRLGANEGDEDEEGEEDEFDLFTSVGDVVDEGNDAEIFYKDFFAPPSRKILKAQGSKPAASNSPGGKQTGVRFHEEVRVKNIKAKGKNLPVSTTFELVGEEDDEEFGEDYSTSDNDEEDDQEGGSNESDEDSDEDMGSEDVSEGEDDDEAGEPEEGWNTRETIERFKNDLFADDGELEDAGLSNYQKRMTTLQDEIAALEAENVSDKHWTLMGEATSRSRPQNALLEEDLEFDRVMKSVPVITEDVVHSLEERIKARITEDRYDDVVRKRPMDDKPFLPSRLFELQDTKSKQSLAEIYEDEYVAAKTGGVAGEDRDGKLKKEHEEIERIWEALCAKMDALSNAHFTPKAPKASISTISNIASATLESALPTTKATSTMLAPEEIFTPSLSDMRAKSELTPTEKRALHNKQKKVKRKARDLLEKSVDAFAKMKGKGSVNKQKDAALKSVVKNGKGITVIGKKSKEVLKDASKKKPRT